MTVTELLEKIRTYYLTRFEEGITEKENSGVKIISEPELFDKNGDIIHQGSFNSPYRNDLVVVKDGKAIESIMIDTENKLSFNPITINWTEKMEVTIHPFQWNFLSIETFQNIDNFQILEDWFNAAFNEKPNQSRFKNAVHFISDPYSDGTKTKIDIDLGSGLVDDFYNLLDALDKTGLNKIEIK